MEKVEFHRLLIRGCQRVRTFSEKFLLEPLPSEFRLRVRLNSSHDNQPQPDDVTLYPQDSFEELTIRNRSLTSDEATNLLWRADEVPVWIDVSVVSITASHTVIELMAAGRFSANEDYFYYSDGGRKSPFGLKGPALPASYRDEKPDRFSIHHRASSWTIDEYRAIGTRKMLARFLEFGGPDFDDAFLNRIDEFQHVQLLELKFTPVRGPGLCGLGRMPNLRFIRILIYPNGPLSFSALADMPRLEELTVHGLASPLSELAALATKAPLLKELSFGIESIDTALLIPELPHLKRLTIFAGQISRDVNVNELAKLESLTLDGPFTDATISRMLDRTPSVANLHLSGTQASVDVIESIRSHPRINYADLSKSLIDASAIDLLRSERPDMRIS